MFSLVQEEHQKRGENTQSDSRCHQCSEFYEKKLKILKYIDVPIDGQFEEDKKDLTLKHKGSTNQREVNVKESLNKNKVVLVSG